MSTIQGAANNQSAEIFGQLFTHDHEELVFCQDKHTGLKAIIAIHNTVLGPGLGGTRIWNYTSEAEAVNDVLRLSRGMTYKAAISGLNLGGAKAVKLKPSCASLGDLLKICMASISLQKT
jgi:leucine dehydrogenase